MIWLSFPIVLNYWMSVYVHYIIANVSILYTQAYGLWPQVWPVSDVEVIKGYEKFLYRLMLIIE